MEHSSNNNHISALRYLTSKWRTQYNPFINLERLAHFKHISLGPKYTEYVCNLPSILSTGFIFIYVPHVFTVQTLRFCFLFEHFYYVCSKTYIEGIHPWFFIQLGSFLNYTEPCENCKTFRSFHFIVTETFQQNNGSVVNLMRRF